MAREISTEAVSGMAGKLLVSVVRPILMFCVGGIPLRCDVWNVHGARRARRALRPAAAS